MSASLLNIPLVHGDVNNWTTQFGLSISNSNLGINNMRREMKYLQKVCSLQPVV